MGQLIDTMEGLIDEDLLEKRMTQQDSGNSIVMHREWWLKREQRMVRRDAWVTIKAGLSMGGKIGGFGG